LLSNAFNKFRIIEALEKVKNYFIDSIKNRLNGQPKSDTGRNCMVEDLERDINVFLGQDQRRRPKGLYDMPLNHEMTAFLSRNSSTCFGKTNWP
jgi:hypothetical protein